MAKYQQLYDSRFDAFSKIPYDNSDIYSYYQAYSPVSALQNSDSNIIEFAVLGGQSFIDTTKTRLKIRVQILDSNNKPITGSCNVGPINNILHSAFRSISVSINGQNLTDEVHNYFCFKNEIEYILERNGEWITTYGDSAGVKFEMPFTHDTGGPLSEQASGLRERAAYFWDTGSHEFDGFLNIDCFKLKKYLAPNVPFTIRLFQNSAEFFLQKGDEESGEEVRYKFIIQSATLYVYYVMPSARMVQNFEKALKNQPAVYEYPKVTMKAFVIAAQLTSVHIDNILTDLPNEIICVLVNNRAVTGSMDTCPYNFATYYLNYASLTFDGREIGGKAKKPKFKEEDVSKQSPDQEFDGLYTALYDDSYTGPRLITPRGFRGGYCLIKWNLTKHLKRHSEPETQVTGLTRLSLGFDVALPHPVNAIIYTIGSGAFSIDSARNVKVEL